MFWLFKASLAELRVLRKSMTHSLNAAAPARKTECKGRETSLSAGGGAAGIACATAAGVADDMAARACAATSAAASGSFGASGAIVAVTASSVRVAVRARARAVVGR